MSHPHTSSCIGGLIAALLVSSCTNENEALLLAWARQLTVVEEEVNEGDVELVLVMLAVLVLDDIAGAVLWMCSVMGASSRRYRQ